MQKQQSVTVTLTPKEQELLLVILESFQHLDTSLYQDQVLDHLEGLKALHKKLLFLFPNQSGDLCRHPVQSPDAVGQDGTNSAQFDDDYVCDCDSPFCPNCQSPDAVGQGGFICYECENRVSYLFDDSRCKDCTRLTLEEVQGNVRQESINSPFVGLTFKAVRQGGTIECIDTIHCLCPACADHK